MVVAEATDVSAFKPVPPTASSSPSAIKSTVTAFTPLSGVPAVSYVPLLFASNHTWLPMVKPDHKPKSTVNSVFALLSPSAVDSVFAISCTTGLVKSPESALWLPLLSLSA